jgi:hypothetical protein
MDPGTDVGVELANLGVGSATQFLRSQFGERAHRGQSPLVLSPQCPSDGGGGCDRCVHRAERVDASVGALNRTAGQQNALIRNKRGPRPSRLRHMTCTLPQRASRPSRPRKHPVFNSPATSVFLVTQGAVICGVVTVENSRVFDWLGRATSVCPTPAWNAETNSEALYLNRGHRRAVIRRAGLWVLVIATPPSERDKYGVAFLRGVRGRTDQNFELILVS